ncbi:molybdenum cofactor biosynthesis protein MoaE [Candidatus Bathyarchaeota archaeon]|nr:molybdenum cofactor biosynthesis protein MoaE [Candidatus Bathyarchaeota archaeon]
MIRVTKENFSVDDVIAGLKSRSTGGIVSFLGVVRGESKGKPVEHIEIEVYEEMAQRQLDAIRSEAIDRFGVEEVAIVHRYGSLKASENILLIVVASAHRAEAFEACRYVIDEIKRRVPIWKKEVTPEGEWWVESEGFE